ncbi:MAG TPA: gamma carbonic anhydrase family protein [Actinomycetota bacterium]|jgi:carbonic anhydrase/acetyltransferase-like protein (isoleucine patch superfamily)|nr:gamma carbonic anhydrase family protein [Actinomycetota bacterium]
MLIEHNGKRPVVDPSAYVAPTAVLSGDVRVGAETRILFGAVLTAEGGPVEVGAHCIVMENAVLRGSKRHPVAVGDHVLIGPRAYLTGCTVEDQAFLATGATVFNGARIGRRAEVRINGLVHLQTVLPSGGLVPIGWVAVGDPAEILPASEHDRIWRIQQKLDFPRVVWGVDEWRDSMLPDVLERYSRALGRHSEDRILDEQG